MGLVNRANRVPQWQQEFQKHDGVRQWNRGPRARAMLLTYYTLLTIGGAGSFYMMTRLTLGHKTWFGKG